MSLLELERILLGIVILTILFFVITIAVTYWNSRKSSNNYLENKEFKLRYFIQKQVDYQDKTIGYECLLRQQNADGSWSLPDNLDSLPLQRVVFLLEDTFKSLPAEPITLSINLEYNQIISPEFQYFVRWAISKIEPMNLSIEYTPGKNNHFKNRYLFEKRIREAQNYNMQFGIDNVGSNLQNLKEIEWMLPFVDNLKCSMRDFRKDDPNVWLDLNLQSWNRISQENNINLILMGIENEDDEALAEQLNIKTRQGYLFGHPENPERTEKQ
ncbi:EAL domain-containing protein [Companilactobacillus nantensis]|uniref:Diguanylate cyclase phosphodiesterase domain-containing protein n=1 Tax=Companilactobacillus nantensis DSM 16982 TaxID=1423774 RepID=A0A0R1WNB1_9LACO|nr:EAL domain-containing protein [Companilactobacillus nantensis]KRM17193.1 diguanylate cyclase phosphodiesterase domain-containing protein [Companilactobacillus nantensis DSM 16982]GEO64130.1 diguanylate cyclase [Companilactobacillus nantensis]